MTDERERLLKKYGVNGPTGLKREKKKRETICRQFEQDNNLVGDVGDAAKPRSALTQQEEVAKIMEATNEIIRRRSEAIKEWWARQPKTDATKLPASRGAHERRRRF